MQLKAVKGAKGEDRAAIRRHNARVRRRTFFRDQIHKHPAGSFERFRQALDFLRAIADDLDPDSREALCTQLVGIALERNQNLDCD